MSPMPDMDLDALETAAKKEKESRQHGHRAASSEWVAVSGPDVILALVARVRELERGEAQLVDERDSAEGRLDRISAALGITTEHSNRACPWDEIEARAEQAIRERDEARQDAEDQARLNGMGSEREARLMAERDELAAALRKALDLMGGNQPPGPMPPADPSWETVAMVRDLIRAALAKIGSNDATDQ